jgi:hypothetical protein
VSFWRVFRGKLHAAIGELWADKDGCMKMAIAVVVCACSSLSFAMQTMQQQRWHCRYCGLLMVVREQSFSDITHLHPLHGYHKSSQWPYHQNCHTQLL